MCQVVATTFSCFIQVVVLNLSLNNIDQVCEPHQPDHFTCPGGKVFFSGKPSLKGTMSCLIADGANPQASVIWGLIGPANIFSPGHIYSGLLFFFVLGAIVPIVIYFAIKRWPKSFARFLISPLIFGGAGAIPPATPLNYLSWGIVGFVFQFLIKRRYFGWWSRLNFLTSSGLDLGLALATLFIFFAFTLHDIEPPKWWGNDVVDTTMDVQGTAVQFRVSSEQRFGPDSW